MKTAASLLIGLCCAAATAQTLKLTEAPKAAPIEFPARAAPLDAAELKAKVAGRSFNLVLHDRSVRRIEYKSSGYFFVNAGGFNTSGPWDTDGSRICVKPRGEDTSCLEVRQLEGALYLKCTTGEVVPLVPL